MLPKNNLPSTQTAKTIDVSRNTLPILTRHLNLGGTNLHGQSIQFTSYYMLKDGRPCIPVMGEFHFSRYLKRYWEEELLKMKAGGIEIIATYVFWIHIEEEEGVFDWSQNNDLRQFISLCAKHHLQAIVRIGPFAHGECRNGGMPDWLYGRPFMTRSSDERYLYYVQRFYQAIASQLEGLLFKDGGPVIGIQIENEYMHAGAPWEVTFRQGTEYVPAGSDGAGHMMLLKRLAQDVGLEVPLYTCTGWINSPVPDGEMLPMQGGYIFTPWIPDPNYQQPPTDEFIFSDRHRTPLTNGTPSYDAIKYPFACCEIGSGIQDTYHHRNVVPPEGVEALTVMKLAGGANLIGYYMYHGGSNPVGECGYLNEFTVPRISYDFQAPLREFGQVADSYRYLRTLHLFLKDFGELLAPMSVVLPDDASLISPDNTTSLRYAARAQDGAGFLFLNNYQDHADMHDLSDLRFAIRTVGEVLTLPYGEPLTLGKNVSAILPFGLMLDSVRLKYATTQLLTKLDDEDGIDYFFFAPHLMSSEYAFDPTTYKSLAVSGGDVIETLPYTYVTVTAGLDQVITLASRDGKTRRIFTLTREQAEHCCKVTLWGKQRLIISEATFVASEDNYYFYSTGQAEISFSIYPPVAGHIDSPWGTFEQAPDGSFTRYTARLPEHNVHLDTELIGTNKAQIKFSPELLDHVSNVYLRVDYVGDIGNAFVDGKLIGDNFYNGSVWEIGLKHFAAELANKALLILISPIQQNKGALKYIPTGMAFRPASDQAGIAAINAITAVPEFKVEIQHVD